MISEDVDDLLECYLEGLMPEAVTKTDCEKRHLDLEKKTGDAVAAATGRTESRLKLWILGGLLAGVIAGLGGYTCAVSEVGAYKERIDNTGRQLEEMKQDLKEMRIDIRTLLLRKEGP